MKLKRVKATIKGATPLLLHSPLLADKTYPFTIRMSEIRSDRKLFASEDGQREFQNAEWEGGLYVNSKGRVIIPPEHIEGTLVSAAGSQRGKRKDVIAGVTCEMPAPVLQYKGPQTVDGLREDRRFRDVRSCNVQRQRIMRTRPRFDEWSLTFTLCIDPELLNVKFVKEMLVRAGARHGIGDYRPKFGLFRVIDFTEISGRKIASDAMEEED